MCVRVDVYVSECPGLCPLDVCLSDRVCVHLTCMCLSARVCVRVDVYVTECPGLCPVDVYVSECPGLCPS